MKFNYINYRITKSTYDQYKEKSKKEKHECTIFVFTKPDIEILMKLV